MQKQSGEYLEVVRCLLGVLKHHQHLDELLDATLDKTLDAPLDMADRNITPLVRQICYGVIRQYYSLDSLLNRLLEKPLPPKHLDLKLLLLAGIYSIIELNRPAYASVNSAVETAILLQKPWAKSLVNGVLRQYIRDRERLEAGIETSEARLNHPAWLITALTNAWPGQPEIFRCNNAQGPLTLRVNTRKITRHAYGELLEQQAIAFNKGQLADTAITLKTALPVSALPGFLTGLVSVQDEAPQLAATLLNLAPGLRVLDACAAPGGKTCHILEHEPGTQLVAIDKHRQRVGKIHENLERLGLTDTGLSVLHTALEDYDPDASFDRILLDLPCSGTGIIRRHPDIKLLRKKSDIDKLCSIQRRLLHKAFELLNTHGELLYSTCSVLPDENDQVVRQLLASRPDAGLLPITLAALSGNFCRTETGLQLFPTLDQHDGFFYSRITKLATESDNQRSSQAQKL